MTSSDTIEKVALLPCPMIVFDWLPEHRVHVADFLPSSRGAPVEFAAGCRDCDIYTDQCRTREEAIAAWNTRAAISAYEQSEGWQPIDSAPKDGTEFLAYGEEMGWQVVDYDPSPKNPDWWWAVMDGATYHKDAFTHWCQLTPPGAEAPAKPEPTQFGDDVAAEMRAYFEAHKRDKWQEGNADNLMLGLFNIAANALSAKPVSEQSEVDVLASLLSELRQYAYGADVALLERVDAALAKLSGSGSGEG